MISYVKLKNFISFGDICFDFRKTKHQVKNFAAIYGENGSGKTNFITSIQFLIESLFSVYAMHFLQSLRERINADKYFIQRMQEELNAGETGEKALSKIQKMMPLQEFTTFIKSCRTQGCSEPSEVEYGFHYKEHDGVYRITFTDRIIKESLRYWTGKQTGQMFSVEMQDGAIITKLSPKMSENSRVRQDIAADIEKFWGKHTVLGIISNQIHNQNEIYTRENYSAAFHEVLYCIHTICAIKNTEFPIPYYILPVTYKYVLKDVANGTISAEELPVLKRTERILNQILTQTYADIKEVTYHTNKVKDTINYKLFLKKMIAGEIREINVDDESTGTLHILEILTPLMGALTGMTVFIDEADTGIHDILFRNIIESIKDDITGQLILTTHNTTLMEKIDPQNAYIISVDYEGNKEAVCIDEYDVQKTNNVRSLYLKGVFGGVPVQEPFDDRSVLNELQQPDDPDGGTAHDG